jgi:hypothetical protein
VGVLTVTVSAWKVEALAPALPVPVAVQAATVAGEIDAHYHLAGQGAVRRDARIDDGHAHARAVHRAQSGHQSGPRRLGAGAPRGQRHVRGHHRVGRHGLHRRVGGQGVELTRRHFEHLPTLDAPLQLQRMPRQHAAAGRVAARDDHRDRASVARAQLVLEVAGQARAPWAGVGEPWYGHQEGDKGGEEAGAHGRGPVDCGAA